MSVTLRILFSPSPAVGVSVSSKTNFYHILFTQNLKKIKETAPTTVEKKLMKLRTFFRSFSHFRDTFSSCHHCYYQTFINLNTKPNYFSYFSPHRNLCSSSSNSSSSQFVGKAKAHTQHKEKLEVEEEHDKGDENVKEKKNNKFEKDEDHSSRNENENENIDSNNDESKERKSQREDYSLPVSAGFFESVNQKNKETFLTAIEVFQVRDKNARGHCEFIYAALKHMRHFGVHRDLETYKKLIDVFPKGRFVAQNMFQVEFQHYPKQQDCAVNVLDQMEDMGVMPDTEMQILLTNIFGTYGFPLRKLMRMMYWMPKFKNLSPWTLPDPLPDDSLELAKLAIQRITSVDLKTQITCFNAMDLEDATDHTWIVSGQSPDQMRLIQEHPSDRPIYVEGAFRVWMSRTCINYFILRAEPKALPTAKPKDPDDVGILTSIFKENFIEKQITNIPTVHEQEDGVILAICATGTSSRDSIISWLQFLQESNPRLGKDITILITLKSPLGPTDDLEPQELEKANDEIKLKIGEHPNKFIKDKKDEEEKIIGFDPSNPELEQVGISELSDTKFLNWPHHHNEISIKNRMKRKSMIGEGEKKETTSKSYKEFLTPS